MAKIGSLHVTLGLNTAEFNKNLAAANKRVRRGVRNMRRSFMRLESSVGSAAKRIALLAGPLALGYLTAQSFKQIDANAKMARAIGVSSESLETLHTQAQKAGVEIKTFDKAMTTMARTIKYANDGLATYTRDYEKLGLNYKELKDLSPEEQFFTINKALGDVKNSTERLAIATNIYGARAAVMLNMTSLTAAEFYKLREESMKLGKSLNGIDSNKVEMANDAMTDAKKAAEGLGNRIAVGLSPYIKAMADNFYQAALDSNGFATAVDKGIKIAVTAVGYLLDAIYFIKVGWVTINAAFQGMVAGILKGFVMIDEGITNVLNKIPGVSATTSDTLATISESVTNTFNETYANLAEITSQELPHVGLEAWAAKAVESADTAARAFVETNKLQKQADDNSAKSAKKSQDTITSDLMKQAKERFGINKAEAVAKAVQNTYEGATKALAQGGIMGFATAAAVVAAGLANVSSIMGTSFGGGGGGGGGASGGASVPAPSSDTGTGVAPAAPLTGTAQQAPGTKVEIAIDSETDLISTNTLRSIADGLNALVRDGHRIEGVDLSVN